MSRELTWDYKDFILVLLKKIKDNLKYDEEVDRFLSDCESWIFDMDRKKMDTPEDIIAIMEGK